MTLPATPFRADLESEAAIAVDKDACTPARSDWLREEVAALFDAPFLDLLFDAARIHRANHVRNKVQLSTLVSVKTGGCPEDCGYCSQSIKARDGMAATKLMAVEDVTASAAAAAAAGATRFCMGAAWRSPKDRDMDQICAMVREVKGLGLETCMTLGMLTEGQADCLAEAGLDYYNHNIDTSREHYPNVVTTRSFDDRLTTLARVRGAGIAVCCGGILGLGENRADRVGFVHVLATLPRHPESVPVNALVPISGTAAGERVSAGASGVDEIEFVRTIAVARITMPGTVIRLSAGRESMSDSMQAMCFLAGANSIFTGDRLLTTPNAGADADATLFRRLGLEPARHARGALLEEARP